ncbi:MAG: hypothetical protein Tsb002_03090 [Wenzhouxiangellaceae bacterium]
MKQGIVLISSALLLTVSSVAAALSPAEERAQLAMEAAHALAATSNTEALVAALQNHPDGLQFASFLDASGQRGDARLDSESLATVEVWLQRGRDDGFPAYVAYRPAGDEKNWDSIPAYDLQGRAVSLAVDEAPLNSVLVVENRGRLSLRQTIEQANAALQQLGLQHRSSLTAPTTLASKHDTRATGVWTTRLDRIRLDDDQEPWILGKAEIYAITSGVFDNNQANIQIIDMPYLDHKDTTYYPRQIMLNWNDYNYAAANIMLYEHDDNTNYQTLVSTLITAVGQIGSLAGLPQATAIATIANTIINAMPSNFFTNDDDFVDAYYTIEKNVSYINLRGAGNNANANLVPFFLQSN